MAMTGMRRVTKGLGLVGQAPPERVARQGFPGLLARVPEQHRDEAIELAHWTFGAAAAAVFGALPAAVRRRAWGGPVYGLAIWVAFETAFAPLVLGVRFAKRPRIAERLAVAGDHVLYGAVLGSTRSR